MIKFLHRCACQGVKPIIGCDVWIGDDETPRDKPDGNAGAVRVLLLCRNREGYLRLCQLVTQAYLAPRHHGRAEISRAALASGDNSGLIALSGAAFGDVGQLRLAALAALAELRARSWAGLLSDAFYIEVQRLSRVAGQPGNVTEETLVAASVKLAVALGLPIVATIRIQFIAADDAKAHDARVCIAEGYVLSDKRRPRVFSDQQYFKTQTEMLEPFSGSSGSD